MSGCCPQPAGPKCPVCGGSSKSVGKITLDEHVPAPARAQFGEEAWYCNSASCSVVYFCGESRLRVGETSRPVAAKEKGPDVPLCYCFDVLRRDLSEKSPELIKKGIAENRCDCVRKNPSGGCCLGLVAEELKEKIG